MRTPSKPSVPGSTTQGPGSPTGVTGRGEGFDWQPDDDEAVAGAWDEYRAERDAEARGEAPPAVLSGAWWRSGPYGKSRSIADLIRALNEGIYPMQHRIHEVELWFRQYPALRKEVPPDMAAPMARFLAGQGYPGDDAHDDDDADG